MNISASMGGYINAANAELEIVTHEMSSGEKKTLTSAEYHKKLVVEDDIGIYKKVNRDLTLTKVENQVADKVMSEMKDVVTSFKSKMILANNATTSDTDRTVIANELKSYKDAIIDMANTEVMDNNLFSGSDKSIKPFSYNFDTDGHYTDIKYQGTATKFEQDIGKNISKGQGLTGLNLMDGLVDAMGNLKYDKLGQKVASVDTDGTITYVKNSQTNKIVLFDPKTQEDGLEPKIIYELTQAIESIENNDLTKTGSFESRIQLHEPIRYGDKFNINLNGTNVEIIAGINNDGTSRIENETINSILNRFKTKLDSIDPDINISVDTQNNTLLFESTISHTLSDVTTISEQSNITPSLISSYAGQSRPQLRTISINDNNIEYGDTYTLTINNLDISYRAGDNLTNGVSNIGLTSEDIIKGLTDKYNSMSASIQTVNNSVPTTLPEPANIKQISTLKITDSSTNIDIGDRYSITIDTDSTYPQIVSYTVDTEGMTPSEVATNLVDKYNNKTTSPFNELEVSIDPNDDTKIILIGKTAGEEYTITSRVENVHPNTSTSDYAYNGYSRTHTYHYDNHTTTYYYGASTRLYLRNPDSSVPSGEDNDTWNINVQGTDLSYTMNNDETPKEFMNRIVADINDNFTLTDSKGNEVKASIYGTNNQTDQIGSSYGVIYFQSQNSNDPSNLVGGNIDISVNSVSGWNPTSNSSIQVEMVQYARSLNELQIESPTDSSLSGTFNMSVQNREQSSSIYTEFTTEDNRTIGSMIDRISKNVFEKLNIQHANLGNSNAIFERVFEQNEYKLNSLDQVLQDTIGIDIAEASIKLQQLQLMFASIFSTIQQVNQIEQQLVQAI
jgi:flagellin-like hook-associated protein FlgL